MAFKTIDALPAKGQRILLRADLNVPVKDGRITDRTRIERLCPTIAELAQKGARVVVLSHFDRPKGKRVPEMSLKPMQEALAAALARPVAWCDDCVGTEAEAACCFWKIRAFMLARKRMTPPWQRHSPSSAMLL